MSSNDERFLSDVRTVAGATNPPSFVYSKEENGYVFDGNVESFECPSCQSLVTFGECECGIMWNTYHVFEDNAVKTIARDIDVTQIPKKVANLAKPNFELL